MRISDWSSDVCSSDLYHIKITDAITLPTPNDVFGPCFEEGDAAACALIRRDPLNGSLNGGGDTPGQIADRKSVVEGKRCSLRVDLGGRRTIKKKKESCSKHVPASVQ